MSQWQQWIRYWANGVQLLFVVDGKQQSLQQQSTLFHEIKENICKETVNICSLVCYEVLSRDAQPAQKMEISTSTVLLNRQVQVQWRKGLLIKFHPMEAKLFHAGRQTDRLTGQSWRITFCNSVKCAWQYEIMTKEVFQHIRIQYKSNTLPLVAVIKWAGSALPIIQLRPLSNNRGAVVSWLMNVCISCKECSIRKLPMSSQLHEQSLQH